MNPQTPNILICVFIDQIDELVGRWVDQVLTHGPFPTWAGAQSRACQTL